MINRFLKQEEIDALLNTSLPEPDHTGKDAGLSGEQAVSTPSGVEQEGEQNGVETNATQLAGQAATEPEPLTEQEKDALGEVGNICMGSSSTTLSLLLNQPVTITSPRVTVTTMGELFKSFTIPHMSIRVQFTEGFSGYNLLIIKLHDAAILADLMMGGDGTNISEEITEIVVSAASEAMNQMIGAASTAMATMFNRTVNISPPETKIYHNDEDLEITEPGRVVVVWFKMTIGSILDTQIMQVMDLVTAREESGLILGQLSEVGGEEYLPIQEESYVHGLPGGAEEAGGHKEDEGRVPDEQEAKDQAAAAKDTIVYLEKQARTETASARPPAAKKPVVTQSGIDQRRLDLLLDIPLKVTVLLGRTRWPIKDILELTPGSIVELQSLVDEPVEVLVNGTLVAMGEVVVVNENFGVRLTSIIKPEERLQNLGK